MAGKLTCVNIETTQLSSVTTPAVVGADTDWLDTNSTSGTMTGVVYRKLPTGMVLVRFTASSIANATLPVGYRPADDFMATVISDASEVGAVVVFASGLISPTVALNVTGNQVVSFLAEQ